MKTWLMKLFGRQASGSMSCRKVGEVLQEYLDGRIDDERSSRIEVHLEECRRCGMEADAYARIKSTLATKRPDLPAESLDRLRHFGDQLARGEGFVGDSFRSGMQTALLAQGVGLGVALGSRHGHSSRMM